LDDLIEQRVILSQLFDIYEPALTEKQRVAFRLHVMEDWSLSEVAERLDVTRQGAHDLVQRARGRLLELEGLLGFSAREAALESRVEKLREWRRRHLPRIPAEAAAELASLLAAEEGEV